MDKDELPDLHHPGCPTRPSARQTGMAGWTPTVIVIIVVLGSAAALLLTGLPWREAVVGATGMAVLSGQIARRIVTDVDHAPILVVAAAVMGLGGTLYMCGYSWMETAIGISVAGLCAGEAAARTLNTPRARMGV